MKNVSNEELRDIMFDNDVLIVDIRENKELEQTEGKLIPKSLHIPYSDLTKNLDKLNYDKDIYIICRHGNSSVYACRLIESYEKSKDTNIFNVKEGYIGWQGELTEKNSLKQPA